MSVQEHPRRVLNHQSVTQLKSDLVYWSDSGTSEGRGADYKSKWNCQSDVVGNLQWILT